MLCAVPSRLPKMRGDINVKDAGRDASCLSHTSPRRAWDRSAIRLGLVRASLVRAGLLGVLPVLDTSAVGRLGIVRKQAGAGKHACKYPSVSITLASSRGRRALLSHLRPLASREQVQKFLVDRHVLAQSKTA